MAVFYDHGLDKLVNVDQKGTRLTKIVWYLIREIAAKLTLDANGPRIGFCFPEFLMMLIRNYNGAKNQACLPNDLYFWLQFVTGPQGANYNADPSVRL